MQTDARQQKQLLLMLLLEWLDSIECSILHANWTTCINKSWYCDGHWCRFNAHAWLYNTWTYDTTNWCVEYHPCVPLRAHRVICAWCCAPATCCGCICACVCVCVLVRVRVCVCMSARVWCVFLVASGCVCFRFLFLVNFGFFFVFVWGEIRFLFFWENQISILGFDKFRNHKKPKTRYLHILGFFCST